MRKSTNSRNHIYDAYDAPIRTNEKGITWEEAGRYIWDWKFWEEYFSKSTLEWALENLSIGDKKLGDIVQEFLIVVSPNGKVSVVSGEVSEDILETDVEDGAPAKDVTCKIYVVIKDTTVVNEKDSATMSALTAALAEAKLTVEFVASGN